MHTRFLAALLLCATLGGCGSVTACPDDLQQRIDPPAVTLPVGGTARPTVQFLACGGTKPLVDLVSWQSRDPAIASVHEATGVITAHAPGTTIVTPRGATYGTIGHVTVTVQ